jgi:hypothetical protein
MTYETDRRAAAEADPLTTLSDDEILALVQTESQRLDRRIRWRDRREMLASVIVAPVIAAAALRGPLLARAGALVILAGIVVVVTRLWLARRAGGRGAADASLSVADALRAELRRVSVQISLLESVAWWYVLPLMGGSVLMVAGLRGASTPFTIGYALVAAAIAWGIIVLNRHAVHRGLAPRRDELTALLTTLES